MALSITGQVLGFPTDIYAKITGTDIRETGANEQGKLYGVTVYVHYFTNSTKEHCYQQKDFRFSDVQTASFTVAGMYALLKTQEEFQNALDC